MKKIKIFNKFLLTSTILLASVSITPLILTSCSKVTQEQDSTNNDPNNNQKPPSSDGNTQKPGDNDSTQKPSQPTIPKAINIPNLEKINPTKINDSFYFDIKGQISDPNQNQNSLVVNNIYDSIVVDKNKFVNDILIKKYNFNEQKQYKNTISKIDVSKDKLILEKSDYTNEKDSESLKKILLDGGLKWFSQSKSLNKNSSNDFELNLSALNIDDLINNADVNCEINFIDKPIIESNADQNLLKENNKYEFKYTIKPKNNNYWSNVDKQYNQSSIIIRFEKIITDISLVENISSLKIIKLGANTPIKNQESYYIIAKKDELSQVANVNELFRYLNELLNLNISSDSSDYWNKNLIPIPKSSYEKLIELIKDINISNIFTNSEYIDTTVSFDWETANNNMKVNLSLDNLIYQLKKRRLDVFVASGYTSKNRRTVINLQFKLTNSMEKISNYKWFDKHNTNNTMPIVLRLEWTDKPNVSK